MTLRRLERMSEVQPHFWTKRTWEWIQCSPINRWDKVYPTTRLHMSRENNRYLHAQCIDRYRQYLLYTRFFAAFFAWMYTAAVTVGGPLASPADLLGYAPVILRWSGLVRACGAC